MKKIKLNQNLISLVDDEDFERVNTLKWYFHKDKRGRISVHNHTKGEMHRFILNAPREFQVDHANHDTLDNRRENLRLCTSSQNQMNRKIVKHNSRFKGVTWHKRAKKWQASIKIGGKPIYLGLYKSEIDAADTYNAKARDLFKEFALLNET